MYYREFKRLTNIKNSSTIFSYNKILLTDEKLKQTSIIGTFSENIQNKDICLNSGPYPIAPDPTAWRLMNEIHGSTKIDRANNTLIIASLGALLGGPIGGNIGKVVSAIYNRINAGRTDYYYKKRWYERNSGGYDKEYKKIFTCIQMLLTVIF